MDTRVKANPVASVDKPPVELSIGAMFIDGSPINHNGGGVVADGGQYYSVARADMVPDGGPATRTEAGGYAVPANRMGRIAILSHTTDQPTTYGVELEAVHMDGAGNYASLPVSRLLEINELYTFMTESGTKPTDDPVELHRRYWEMVTEMVAEAESYRHIVGSLAVFGQAGPTPGQINPSTYVQHVVREMTQRTGFPTHEIFCTGGAQGHTGMSNTEAGIQAAEAMQYLNPILMAPTLSGPFLHGGLDGNLARATLTPTQEAHMQRVGVRRGDLSHPYQSWRYLLRRLGSPSAGIWMAPAADGMGGYLRDADDKLARGEINNVDRANGWHTDRARLVLDGSGANSLENCADDTALGNPDANVPLHLLRSAAFTVLEKMAKRGADPRLAVASRLGTASLGREARLELAHHLSLRETSRYGTNAKVYGRQPGQWLHMLMHLVEDAPYTHIGQHDERNIRRMFATREQTTAEVRQWCLENHADSPTPQAYFDLRLNNPAIYQLARYRHLHKTYDGATAVRMVELESGQALHRAVRQRKDAA